MENKTQNYTPEILKIIRSNTSPGIMRNKLEDYHENDLAEVFPELTVKERVKLCRCFADGSKRQKESFYRTDG